MPDLCTLQRFYEDQMREWMWRCSENYEGKYDSEVFKIRYNIIFISRIGYTESVRDYRLNVLSLEKNVSKIKTMVLEI